MALVELLSQVFYGDDVFCPYQLLDVGHRQSGLDPAGGQLLGMDFEFLRG